MDITEIKLEDKLVGEIKGKFFVPSYQRGYRWGKDEVTRLLDDIYANGTKNYCLQPIVVRKTNNGYELIDGQQRLTTLYLIYKYMNISSLGFLDEPHFSLSYETRVKSEEFLSSINKNQKDDNIDFWFICNAYETIETWFANKDKKSTLTNINKFFDENIKVIWYEVGKKENSIALFTRLNIGKIPLTSAELVKSMFLSKDNNPNMTRQKQEEISMQWDNIEKELHNNSFWYFLTNSTTDSYQTRIDLILDLMAEKNPNSKDKYETFFYFDNQKSKESLAQLWNKILRTFLLLKDWFENHELYHLIGYLITSNSKTLQQIYKLSIDKSKDDFRKKLRLLIKQSIKLDSLNYADLSYENPTEYRKISKLLLLFNIESVRQNGENTQWFPFEKFKFNNNGKVIWSLEHIHAQHSEGMKTQEQWSEWIRLHIPAIKALSNNNAKLTKEMQLLLVC